MNVFGQRQKWRRLGLAATAATATAMGQLAISQGAMAAQDYPIDVIVSLTGGGAFLGQAEQRTLKLEEPLINQAGGVHGRPVKFVFHDDQTSPQVAVQEMSAVVATGRVVVLGSTLTGSCNAMAPLAHDGPVIYCFSPGVHPKPDAYMFSASTSTVDLARAMMTYFRMRGLTKVALITSSDASGQDAARSLKAVLAEGDNKSITLVDQEHFNPGDVSVSAQIDRIKAAQPQALVAWTSGGPLGNVLKSLVNAGVDVPVATTDANMTYQQMAQYKPFLPKAMYFPAPWVPDAEALTLPPAAQAARQKFADLFKGEAPPDKGCTLSYDPALIVVAALNALPETTDAQAVRDKIDSMNGYVGLYGTYDYKAEPQRGLGLHNVVVTTWNPQAGTWSAVSQPGGAPLSSASKPAQ